MTSIRVMPFTALQRFHLMGLLLLADWIWLAKLSRAEEAVNVWLFLIIVGLAWLGVLCAWRWAKEIQPQKLVPRLWFWAVMFHVVGFAGQPVLENDFYRYLWDGRQFALTGNPYLTAPADHFGDGNLPTAFVSILDGVNFPHVPTIYGPVSQAAFLLSYWIAPAQLWPLKLLLIAADLLTIWFLLRLTKPSNVLLYAWCPLLIKETAFTAHPDSLAILLLVWALYAFQRRQSTRMALALALALGTKIFAVLLVPFLLWRTPKKHWLMFGGVLAGLYLPFWLQGSGADFAGLSAFVQNWEFNSSVHALLAWMFDATVAKMFCGLAFVACGVLYFLYWHSTGQNTIPRGDLILGGFFLISATVNPWYLLWLLPFVVLSPSVTGLTALAVVSLAYVSGLNLGDAALAERHPLWVRMVEYGLVAAAMVTDWWRLRTKRRATSAVPITEVPVVPLPSRTFLESTMVLIPALNEAECIAETVAFWRRLGAGVVRVVNNGSTDATAQIARTAGADVVTEPQRGYGAAARRGLQEPAAEVEWILFSSADGSDQLSPSELHEWQRNASAGCALILGDRVGPIQARQHLTAVQSFGNRLCCWLIALGWRHRFNDIGSLRLIRREVLAQFHLQDRGFGWNIEMQVRALEHNLPILELPVNYYARRAGESKISGNVCGSIRAGWGIMRVMIRLWWTRNVNCKLGV